MSRPKGSKNKLVSQPTTYMLGPAERIVLIAGLLIEIICEELWTNE
jgi:hypothetical protein